MEGSPEKGKIQSSELNSDTAFGVGGAIYKFSTKKIQNCVNISHVDVFFFFFEALVT